jgi:hypothetical protein
MFEIQAVKKRSESSINIWLNINAELNRYFGLYVAFHSSLPPSRLPSLPHPTLPPSLPPFLPSFLHVCLFPLFNIILCFFRTFPIYSCLSLYLFFLCFVFFYLHPPVNASNLPHSMTANICCFTGLYTVLLHLILHAIWMMKMWMHFTKSSVLLFRKYLTFR